MDKFIEIISKQNPYTELGCKNPECGKKSKVKTRDFLGAGDTYTYTCPHCGMTTDFNNIKEQIEGLKKKFKNIGIKW